MNLTIIDNLVDLQECKHVCDAYMKFQNGELSKAAWENTARYPRKQWLQFDKTEALPFIVTDNRDGECFIEDFETLDGALQYILDIKITHEHQEQWDVHGALKDMGGWKIKGVAKDDTPLHELVLAFAKCDDEIAQHGWDGGEREERWENTKTSMVNEALRIREQGKEE